MYTRYKYSARSVILWTRYQIILFLIWGIAYTVAYEIFDLQWLRISWTPIGLVGTAVAFLIGFQSNSAYGRIWEARKIWGGIVNASRTWTILVKDVVSNEHATKGEELSERELAQNKTTLVHRHIAWMTALRYAMRQHKSWEIAKKHKTNKEWGLAIPELEEDFEGELRKVLSEEELVYVMSKTNKAATLLSLQSKHIRELKEKGIIWDFSFLELENVLKELMALQGKSERIKNFPYPRQFATIADDFVKIFVFFVPFGVIPEFSKIGLSLTNDYPLIAPYFVWVGVIMSSVISWVFHTMQRIGTVGENPFEGGANDVPISTMARAIEIDLREMLDEENIPAPRKELEPWHVQL
ncbi:MAG: hypothetical protein GY827_07830 [Cytophagales bacterium]|nr:hypothetical protein [Cytophagales bacterium]